MCDAITNNTTLCSGPSLIN